MQVYGNSNKLSVKTILFFLVVLFIAYLPVSSFLFFLKNDAFNGYFPPKFFMSESIHAGHLPLWNPYINFGIPQYGDMSGGYWSPITWLIASTTGYNAYTLTIELLSYILLSGIGMYKLCGLWVTDKRVLTIAAISFMCSGYQVGHLQHFNWLSGAAFLPFCMWSYILMLRNFSWRNIIAAALLFYMLLASAHPGITISAFYFFAAIFVFHFVSNEEKVSIGKRVTGFLKTHGLFFLILLLLSAGMIAGYLDILPHFVRTEKISLEDSLGNPTNAQSWISSLLPFATVKNDPFYNTDISMRNCYFGITLLLFFLMTCIGKKTTWQKFLLWTALFFALLSAGGIFKTVAYKLIPFIGYVRLNGEFRIFAILCFILIGAIELEKNIKEKKEFSTALKKIYYPLEIILIACIAFGLYRSFSDKESFIYSFKTIIGQHGFAAKLKSLIDAFSFYDTLWIQGFIQLLFLWFIKWSLKFQDYNLLKKLSIANMVIACLINIPFTGVGKASVSQVQAVLNKSPRGIPIPALLPVIMNDSLSTEEKGLVGDWSMYSKQIGVKERVPYPILLNNMNRYFETNMQGGNFLDHPFIFLVPDKKDNNIVINSFSGNKINLRIKTDTASLLILQQNFYPHWYYQTGIIRKEVNQAGINFMSAPVSKTDTSISFIFDPVLVKWMMLLSAVSFLLTLIFYVALTKKPVTL